jgi:DNA-binding transcriptional LysR family regulator
VEISLDQVRALVATADYGSVIAASRALHKTHTAILYQLRQLEAQVGFALLDRDQYKTRLTPQGEIFLVEARRLLKAKERLCERAQQININGLGRWHLVYDAIFPVNALLTIVEASKAEMNFSVRLISDSLRNVEKTFWKEESDFMISLFPPENSDLHSVELGQLRSVFVVGKGHPLVGKAKAKKEDVRAVLEKQTLVLVREGDPQLVHDSEFVHWNRKLVVNDFYAKKECLVRGLGVGWMPEHLVQEEIYKKTLIRLKSPLLEDRAYKVFYSCRLRHAQELIFSETCRHLKKAQWLHH